MRPVTYPPADGVLVAYSGGKDSLAVLDLAIKHYERVEPFFMALLPGLDYTRVIIRYAERRFRVKIREYPHWFLSTLLKHGVFTYARPEVREVGMQTVIRHARAQSGLHYCGLGYRIRESMLQRRWLSRIGWEGPLHVDGRWAPIRDWTTAELIAHLRREHIVVPGMSARREFRPSGIDLSADALHTLRRCWPRDYERLMAVFPFSAAQADRKETLDERRKAWAEEWNKSQKAQPPQP